MQQIIKNKSGGNEDKEINKAALTDPLSFNKFKGKCYKDRDTGHKAMHCPTCKNGGSGGVTGKGKAKFTGTCNNCGNVGHKVDKCWEKSENMHLHPNN